jgi:hypothetical protein
MAQAEAAAVNRESDVRLSQYPLIDIEYDLATAQEILERMERIWQWLTETLNLPDE